MDPGTAPTTDRIQHCHALLVVAAFWSMSSGVSQTLHLCLTFVSFMAK